VRKTLLVDSLRLIQALAVQPYCRASAARDLGIPRREWYRHLTALRLAGLPIVRQQEPGGRPPYGGTVWYSVDLASWLRQIERARQP
jgi:biotin operon repressor